MRIKEITDSIEQYAPLRLQEEWDNAGIQVGDPEAEITGVLVGTDATEAVVAEAIERGFNLVISHHPLIFRGLKKIMGRTPVERAVAMAIKHDITIYSAHTNMDSAWQGVSFRMADKIGMTHVDFLDVNDVAAYGSQATPLQAAASSVTSTRCLRERYCNVSSRPLKWAPCVTAVTVTAW